MAEISTKPYLLRAIYEWCSDNGYTPYLAALVDNKTQVPMQFVKNGEIVLNISFKATNGLKMENDAITFNARFGGIPREIMVPVENVIAIYARENGQGMAFEVATQFPAQDAGQRDQASDPVDRDQAKIAPLAAVPSDESPESAASSSDDTDDEPPTPPKKAGKPTLTRIK